jgi:hypothetical protein
MKLFNILTFVFILFLSSLTNAQVTTIRTIVNIIRYSDGSGMSEQTARDAVDILNDYYTNTGTNMKFILRLSRTTS